MQYIHLRLLYKLLPTILRKVRRLELTSVLECIVLDQFGWCQTLLHHIADVRLRNFRVRPMNLTRLFASLNTQGLLTVLHFERIGLTWSTDQPSTIIHHAFTSLILHAKHLVELSLAYNNLNSGFIQWLCQMLLFYETTSDEIKVTWWSVACLNLTFNLISSESVRRLVDAMKEYKNRWRIRHSPIKRLDIAGNALELRETPTLKKQCNGIGCDLVA